MCRRSIIAVLALLGVLVLSDRAWARRRLVKTIDEATHSERFDMGVKIHVVRQVPGAPELLPGLPLQILRTHLRGHMCRVWTEHGRQRAAWCGPSAYRTTWFVSEYTEPLVLHDDKLPAWLLVQGSEGSGKTAAMAQWLWLRVIEHVGFDREIGFTAPIEKRLEHLRREIARLWPAGTYRYNAAQKLYTTHAGVRVQLVSAHIRSEAEGSPLQGYTWVDAASDELQDHHSANDDIMARLRGHPTGRPKRFCSSTFKDSSEWRNFKADAEKAKVGDEKLWHLMVLYGRQSPFRTKAYWDRLASGMSDREYRRRVLAEDVGPERQVYYSWKRDLSVQPLPTSNLAIRAEDVTAEVLREWGHNIQVLAGHDPGKRQHVTVFLKAFRFESDVRRGDKLPRWFIVGEVTSPECIVESHVQEVLKYARAKWSVNEVTRDRQGNVQIDPAARKMLVRIDPHSRSGDNRPGRDYYSIWRSFGVQIRAAAYDGDQPTQIKKESRLNLVNTILCNSEDVRRLFVAEGEAKQTIESFERLERDASDDAENLKGASDYSHWTAAVGYALWQVEKKNVVLREAA